MIASIIDVDISIETTVPICLTARLALKIVVVSKAHVQSSRLITSVLGASAKGENGVTLKATSPLHAPLSVKLKELV